MERIGSADRLAKQEEAEPGIRHQNRSLHLHLLPQSFVHVCHALLVLFFYILFHLIPVYPGSRCQRRYSGW